MFEFICCDHLRSILLKTEHEIAYISQGGFSVIDVRNHGHVPDVELVVHDGTHLLGGKVHLRSLPMERNI
jgi:hypothetical protein